MSDQESGRPNHADVQTRLDQAIAEYHSRIDNGIHVEIEEFVQEYLDIADRLRDSITAFIDNTAARSTHAGEETIPISDSVANASERVDSLAGVDSLGSVDAKGNEEAMPSLFGDYLIQRRIARGGMGAVFLATQLSLDRTVALKTILAGQLASQESIQRFQQEARAAAKFDHPNIVPIFEVGSFQGHHYYSMAFIDGESLSQRIQQGPLPPLEAARICGKIADAMSYAHEREIIHRDLKPANILLDEQEEPKITDFGLAKMLGTDTELTVDGQIVGTPSFMSPEQAKGVLEDIDHRADIYSIGAILYCLLTGRPPLQADNPVDTVHLVRHQDPVPPRRLNAKVPKDLETICLKCLNKNADHRYELSNQLHDDLRRYLEGRPILARPIGPWERSTKWVRRYPLVAASMFAVFLALTIGASVSTFFAIVAQNALVDMKQQYERAENALEETRLTINNYVDTVEHADLLREERFQPLLRELLQGALTHYQRFITQHKHDPETQLELADAISRVANISQSSGDVDEAITAYHEAIHLLTQLSQQEPSESSFRQEMARAYSNLGILYRSTGKFAEASNAMDQSFDISSELVADYPQSIAFAATAVRARTNLGGLCQETSRPQDALHHYNLARTELDLILQRAPEELNYHAQKAQLLRSIGFVHESIGNVGAALNAYQDALTARQFVAHRRRRSESEHDVAITHIDIGRLYLISGDARRALAEHKTALPILDNLVRNQPHMHVFRSDLGGCHLEIGKSFARLQQYAEAESSIMSAQGIFQQLVDWIPTNHIHQMDLAKSYLQLGVVFRATDQLSETRRCYQAAIAIVEPLAMSENSLAAHRSFLSKVYTNLGNLFGQMEQQEQAKELFQKGSDILETLARQYPLVIDYQSTLGANYLNHGTLLHQSGDEDGAEDKFSKAINVLQHAIQSNPDDLALENFLKVAYVHRAQLLDQHSDYGRSINDWEQAHRLADAEENAFFLVNIAQALIKLGQHAEAFFMASQLANPNVEVDANHCFLAACTIAHCVNVLSGDQSISEPLRQQTMTRYVKAAMAALERAKQLGFFDNTENKQSLVTDSRLDGLRQHKEYSEFIESLK